MTMNPYEVLGVTPQAEQEAIHGAFRGLARKYHPDTNPDDRVSSDRMKLINEAYHVLGNAGRRAAYDQHHRPAPTTVRRTGVGEAHPANPAPRSPYRPATGSLLTSRQFTKRLLVWTGTAVTTFLVLGLVAAVTGSVWPLTAWSLGWFSIGAVALLADGAPATPRRRLVQVLGCAGLVVTSFSAAALIAEAGEPSHYGVPLALWLSLWVLIGAVALIARSGRPSQFAGSSARPANRGYSRRPATRHSAASRWSDRACRGTRRSRP